MTDPTHDELPALPEASYEIHFFDSGGQPNATLIDDVGRLMKDYGRRCQREAIAHGVAMERALTDQLVDALKAFTEFYGRLWDSAEQKGAGFLSPESVEKYDHAHENARSAIAAYEAKRRGGA